MEQNKTSPNDSVGRAGKYIKYAIGEIILVVIGILIALQINNWNEARKDRKQEIKYLKNLRADVVLEFQNNDSIIAFRTNKAKASARLLDFKPLETASDVLALENNIQQVFSWNPFIPTNNTYQELLSSGNLNYITNDSVKDYLLELDKMYVSINNAEYHSRREYEEYLYDISVYNGDMLNMFDFQKTAENGVFIFKEPSQIPFNTLIPQYQRLLAEKSFRNGLKLAIMNSIFIKERHLKMAAHLKKLNAFIIEDLKKN